MTKNVRFIFCLTGLTLLCHMSQHAVPQVLQNAISQVRSVALPSDVTAGLLGAFVRGPETIARAGVYTAVVSFIGAVCDGAFRMAPITMPAGLKVHQFMGRQAAIYGCGVLVGHAWRHERTQKVLSKIQNGVVDTCKELKAYMPSGEIAGTVIMIGGGLFAATRS